MNDRPSACSHIGTLPLHDEDLAPALSACGCGGSAGRGCLFTTRTCGDTAPAVTPHATSTCGEGGSMGGDVATLDGCAHPLWAWRRNWAWRAPIGSVAALTHFGRGASLVGLRMWRLGRAWEPPPGVLTRARQDVAARLSRWESGATCAGQVRRGAGGGVRVNRKIHLRDTRRGDENRYEKGEREETREGGTRRDTRRGDEKRHEKGGREQIREGGGGALGKRPHALTLRGVGQACRGARLADERPCLKVCPPLPFTRGLASSLASSGPRLKRLEQRRPLTSRSNSIASRVPYLITRLEQRRPFVRCGHGLGRGADNARASSEVTCLISCETHPSLVRGRR